MGTHRALQRGYSQTAEICCCHSPMALCEKDEKYVRQPAKVPDPFAFNWLGVGGITRGGF
jgi:hypothetical protein